ncbi:hypothetical protein [Asticcacaulis machinosus]|uniref:Cell division protein ZapA n=1 Tax=Asticcacaulis machinosus TaxID=2984211 RepID=A0ABT5HFF4_9CAUL|nr:hypothetical protein [Asticcacaulis machinosus]MDC7674943.1 hypothetical protein [Asticcacaulis machinosus]
MSREHKITVAKGVTSQLHITEEAIDTALSEAAQLIESYVTSRRSIHMSTLMGNDVHEHTLKAMIALNTAQTHMGQAHEALKDIKNHIGLRTVAVGPILDKPEKDTTATQGGLQPLSEQA